MRPGRNDNDASRPDYSVPASAEEGGEARSESVAVHLSLCIPCLRELHASTAAAPPGNTSTEGTPAAGAPAQTDEREEGTTVEWRDTPPSRSSSRWTTQQTEEGEEGEESGEECAEQQWRRMPKRARLAADEMQLDGAGEAATLSGR